MTDYIIAVTRKTYNVLSEVDPNRFIFNSEYNTFKIIKEGIKSCSLIGSTNGQIFTQPHYLEFIPLINAFAKEEGVDAIYAPNSEFVIMVGPKTDFFTTGVKFVSIGADDTNIFFKFDNSESATNVNVKYYCLEAIAI